MKPIHITTAGALALWMGLTCAQGPAQVGAAQPAAPDQETSAAAQRASERASIDRARRRNAEQRQQAQVKCYQLFAVEDCLRDARNQWREAETRLRAQEVQLNDAERKEKAQQRLQQIEEKQSSAAAAATQPASAVVRSAQPGGKPSARASSPDSIQLRDREAAARAIQQRQRQQTQAAEQAARETESAERAAQARQRQADLQKAAQARRAQREQDKADAAASGHKPAAPLPTPP